MTLAERALSLCQIQSPTGQERELADHLESWARAHFPEEQVFRHSHSLIVGELGDGTPKVALVGHLDTVPPHESQGAPYLEAGRLHGRGSSDMKGGLAVMMALSEALPKKLPLGLVLVFYEREEGPYLESGLRPLFELRPELRKLSLAIAMEPTDGVVQVGCVGSLHATLRFSGRSAHSARPWEGENAVHKAGPLLAELLSRPPREVEADGFRYLEVMSATRAAGGRAPNVVPDSFELNLNYRFAPGKSVEQAKQEVSAFVAGRAEVAFTDLAPSGRACADNPLFEKLLAATGLPARPKQAWTDVGRLSELGVDAVNFGPGETAQAHQANESASVEALEVAYHKLAAFLAG
ncbi:MAG: succinyl-diaminopimelate desuccinylase [Myxococcales bacterium]|nr:succinyl-diaminopimelate desuccinylase [Myxococcales bacterium]